LAKAAEKFADWRSTKSHGTRIPESLWNLAAKLAGEHGVWRTARTLRLDYRSLKKRAAEVTRNLAPKRTPSSPQFVEVSPAIIATPADCLIELEHPDGAKMRIHLKGSQTPDLANLCQGFWGNTP